MKCDNPQCWQCAQDEIKALRNAGDDMASAIRDLLRNASWPTGRAALETWESLNEDT